MWDKLNLRTKMLVMLLVPMVLILAGLSSYNFYGARGALNDQIMKSSGYIVGNYSKEMELSLKGKETLLDLVAITLGENEFGDKEKLAFLKQAKASVKGVKSVFVGYEDKRYLDSDGISEKDKKDYDPRTRGWYKQGLASADGTYAEVYEASQTKELSVSIVKKIVRNGQVIGVAGVDMDINSLQAVAKDFKIGKTGYAAILDEKGNFLYHPEYKLTDNIDKIENGAYEQCSKVFMSGQPSVQISKLGGVETLLASAPIGKSGWVFVVSVPKAELFEQVNALGMYSILASVVGLVLLGLIIFAITIKLVQRIKVLDELAERIAKGDLNVDTADMVKTAAEDEIGSLAKSFHNMNTNLRQLIGQVKSSAEQVATSADQLTANSHQSTQAAGNVAEAITQVAQGSEQQVNAINEVSAVIESMSAGIEEVAVTANNMAETAEKAAQATNVGQTTVDQAVSQMDTVGKGAKQAQDVAGDLENSSKQIGEIVELISNIAGQTNLLALNAAIEAARAGEQGKGFAVVAEEVRKLAEQSERAAHQITELIQKNHQSIGNVVVAIDTAIRDVDKGVTLVNSAGQGFKQIAQLVNEVGSQVRDISATLQELSAGGQRIVGSVKQVEKVSEDAAGEVQTISASVEEQSASMEEIASSSQALANLAEKLQQAVQQFKI